MLGHASGWAECGWGASRWYLRMQEGSGLGALLEGRAALENWGSGHVISPTRIHLLPAGCKVGIWIL